MPGVERLAERAAAGLEQVGVPRAGAHGAVAEAERPGGEGERQREQQADARGAERAHGGQHRSQDEHRARRDEADRDEVGDPAEPALQAVDEHAAGGAPVPGEVERERDEDAGREQAEADQVEMALLEHRQPPAPAAGATGTGAWTGGLAGGSRALGA